jgi:uncharacterized membrane protein YraQ (UPF0718 family)
MMIVKKIKNNKLMFAVGLIYIILLLFFPQKGMMAVKNTSYYLMEMLQIMPVIFALTVAIEAWVPKEVITKRLGNNSGIVGNILSLILGSISAGPIYAAFPICKMLLKKGASVVNIVIILSSWAVIKVPMLANEAKFLGLEFMYTRWILTVISIFVMAYISSLVVKKEDISGVEIVEHSKGSFEIKAAYCVGCGICAELVPEYFEMYESKGRFKSVPTEKEAIEAIQGAIEKCPTKAIRYYG